MKSAGRRAEDRVERWLRDRDLRPERFPPRRRRIGKTPDFRVATPAGPAFLVEVKTLTRERPSFGAVTLKLWRARAQFDAVNQGGHLANVLALVATTPTALADAIDAAAPAPAGPLAAVDLVLGFEAAGERVCVLHDAASSRHAPLLARVVPTTRRLVGEEP